jgi:hypothetical protein
MVAKLIAVQKRVFIQMPPVKSEQLMLVVWPDSVFVLSTSFQKTPAARSFRTQLKDTPEKRANAQSEIRRRYSSRPEMSEGKSATGRGSTEAVHFFRKYMSRFQLFLDKNLSPGWEFSEEFFTDWTRRGKSGIQGGSEMVETVDDLFAVLGEGIGFLFVLPDQPGIL